MSATPIRVAILGAGIWTKEAHLPALQKLGKAVELVAVYSRSKNSAITFAEDAKVSLGASSIDVYADDEAPNVDTLLARTDIDGVLIAVAIPYQPALIKKAWAAGKSVASEKPCASTIEIAEDLIRTYRETYEPKGIRWHVLENFTFESGYLEVRRLAESGIIGKLSFFSYSATFWIATDNRFYNTQWRQNPTHSGGYLIDGGVHHSAALRVSLPSPITQISAFASHHKEILPAPDTIQGIAKLEDGTTGTYEISFGSSSTNVTESLLIVGANGHIKLRADGDGARQAGFRVEVATESSPNPEGKFFPSDGVENEIKYFVEALTEKTDKDADYRSSPERALGDVKLIYGSYKSNGNVVKLQ